MIRQRFSNWGLNKYFFKKNVWSTSAFLRTKVISTITVTPFRTLSTTNALYNDNGNNLKKKNQIGQIKIDKPMMMIAFTCKKCGTRSSHQMSKQAYTKGTVAIQCPGCKNRHLIADHLKIFHDNKINIQTLLKAKGEHVSTDVNDLVFEDIPDSLKNVIGHLAKDSPKNATNKGKQCGTKDAVDTEVHTLPPKNG
ncbi:related to Mitochondrial protein import protein ZIM17 [Saccharomycodes ludwigii]|uniref:Related to Mitochondrial protein import protein ZIM17 n=1 Tax=Saccharomycodes ludwigii TaxID=36035 RepID=A0A376BBC5_9ASCO|nr:hypothetical protein SCDLUD_005017 [Saccharomycodes ludwigii]KAH3898694.1 hypothetical protein SCDLUD_005017 [Saccharomycodes ludwigii]SSD61889.1 related to Mitochondrial protein import protein ZIM17 [Saccharomycodes ludwigii]